MIVYARRSLVTDPRAALRRLGQALDRFDTSGSIDDAVAWLVEAGELESAVLDALCPDADDLHPLAKPWRALSCAAGRALAAVMAGHDPAAAVIAGRAALRRLRRLPLPDRVMIGPAEGFAWYGLHPETYVAAGRRLGARLRPGRVVVIGLRGIGAALSAAAAAGLEEEGCKVRSVTVRPRGHPSDRRLVLGPGLTASLARARGAFVVVDEGPGLTGTSFAAASDALVALGVASGRVWLMPSWLPGAVGSMRGAAAWARHEKVLVPFEEAVWPRVRDHLGLVGAVDLSGGAWRGLFGVSVPVHPWHERRKHLAVTSDGDIVWVRFAGVGPYGAALQARAEALATAGLGPAPVELVSGHLVLPFVEGMPLSAASAGLARASARQLAWVARQPGDRPVPVDELIEMISVNVAEGLGPDAIPGGLERWRAVLADGGTVAIDGRPQTHEWIANEGGLLKVDALDHHADHFFPGCQDLAWDVAAAVAETGIGAGLLFPAVSPRLPFYSVAYAAWRLGYATLSAASVPQEKWAPEVERYRGLLTRALARLPRPP